MGTQFGAVPGASAERVRTESTPGPQMAAEVPSRTPGQPGAPETSTSPVPRKTPAVHAAFGTAGGAAIVFHDYASI